MAHSLPDDVVLSVQGVSRAVGSDPNLPRWLAAVLPKSAMAGNLGGPQDDSMEDDEDDDGWDDDGEDEWEEDSALDPVSFELKFGQGVGLVGSGDVARKTLTRILQGLLPPTSGKVVYRGPVGVVAPKDLFKLAGGGFGKKAVFTIAKFMGWPRDLMKERWREIEEFAALEELEGLSGRMFRLQSTSRLLAAAALHIDAPLYVVEYRGVATDKAFGKRFMELLEERVKAGAGLVQAAGSNVEHVAHLCDTVLWFEGGAVAYQGRPVDVAIKVAEKAKNHFQEFSAPLFASLLDNGEQIEIGHDGGTIEFELEVLTQGLEVGFALHLQEEGGHHLLLQQPTQFRSDGPGFYHLSVGIPGGLLPGSIYEAKLMGESRNGKGKSASRDLLEFDFVATNGSDRDTPRVAQEQEVEWNVRRIGA